MNYENFEVGSHLTLEQKNEIMKLCGFHTGNIEPCGRFLRPVPGARILEDKLNDLSRAGIAMVLRKVAVIRALDSEYQKTNDIVGEDEEATKNILLERKFDLCHCLGMRPGPYLPRD